MCTFTIYILFDKFYNKEVIYITIIHFRGIEIAFYSKLAHNTEIVMDY